MPANMDFQLIGMWMTDWSMTQKHADQVILTHPHFSFGIWSMAHFHRNCPLESHS